MKNVFFVFVFLLVGSFAFASIGVVNPVNEIKFLNKFELNKKDQNVKNQNEEMFDMACAMGGSTGEEIICCSASTIEKARACLRRLLEDEVSHISNDMNI